MYLITYLKTPVIRKFSLVFKKNNIFIINKIRHDLAMTRIQVCNSKKKL